MGPYSIRWCQPNDVEAFLGLYSEVFDTWEPSRSWFDWKYSANPYVDELPIVVAERDGDLVGARPFFALPMAIGRSAYLALQPADTMVHPEHRGQGLFTTMTQRAIDHYTEREPTFFFNFPNDQSLPGYRKLGWEVVGQISQFYRIEDSERVANNRNGAEHYRVAGILGGPLVAAYNAICEATAGIPCDVDVRRCSSVPAGELASLYGRSSTASIHAVRDESFLSWRYDNPQWEYSTYLSGDRDASVGVVVGDATGLSTDISVTHIVDVLPTSGDRPDEPLVAILERILADRPDSDVFVAPASIYPPQVLRSLGFYSDEWPPLCYVTRGRTHAVRSLDDWHINGKDLRQPDNWSMSFAELDTS